MFYYYYYYAFICLNPKLYFGTPNNNLNFIKKKNLISFLFQIYIANNQN